MSAAKQNTPLKRVIVDYKNITDAVLNLFTDRYPYGYDDTDIIKFQNAKGEMVKAVPLETEDTKYLIKISVQMDAKIEAFMEDEDSDDDFAGDDIDSPDIDGDNLEDDED